LAAPRAEIALIDSGSQAAVQQVKLVAIMVTGRFQKYGGRPRSPAGQPVCLSVWSIESRGFDLGADRSGADEERPSGGDTAKRTELLQKSNRE